MRRTSGRRDVRGVQRRMFIGVNADAKPLAQTAGSRRYGTLLQSVRVVISDVVLEMHKRCESHVTKRTQLCEMRPVRVQRVNMLV